MLSFAPGSFFAQQAATPENQKDLKSAAAVVLGSEPHIDITCRAADGESLVEENARAQKLERDEKRQKVLSDPRVIETLRVFPEAAGKLQVKIADQT